MKITEFTRDRQVVELGALGAIGGAIGGGGNILNVQDVLKAGE